MQGTVPHQRHKRNYSLGVDFLRRNLVAFLFVVALALFALDGHARVSGAKKDARVAAAQVDRRAFNLAVRVCRLENPRNAYLLLRARAIPKSKDQATSYTRAVAPVVYRLLDCQDTVRLGRPVPLRSVVAEEYLQRFAKGQVPITRGQHIVYTIPIKEYFASP